MKTLFTLLVNLSLVTCLFSQDPNWSWANNSRGTAEVEPRGVALDASGNLYVAGRYALGYAVFGNDTLQGYDTMSMNSDVFLAKYNSVGVVQWSLRAGTMDMDRAHAVAVNAAGEVYLAGYFMGDSIVFGSYTLYNTDSPKADMFLVKFGASGNVLWAKREGSSGWVEPQAMGVDALGNVYVTGIFSGTQSVTFGLTTVLNSNAFGSDADVFLVKYDPTGNISWAKGAGGTLSDFPESLAVSASGIFLAGNFKSAYMSVGTHTLPNTNTGKEELFLAKYDALGNELWAKSFVGDSVDQGPSLAADATGNVYMSAFYTSDSITFGSFTVHNTSPASSLYKDDMLLVKFDGNGIPLWVRTAEGTDDEQTSSIAADAAGNIYLAGHFKGDSMVIGSTSLFPYGGASGGYDMVFAKYDPNGSMQWALRAGGDGSDYDAHITADALGNVYMAGYFGSSNITFGSSTVTKGDEYGTFISKLSETTSSGIEDAESVFAIHVYPNPSRERITVSVAKCLKGEICIYNAVGEKIYRSELSAHSTSSMQTVIDLSGKNSGLYFVQVKNEEGGMVTKKVLLNR